MSQSFIEVQFPVSKLSKESYKERKAGDSQTLASLGKWHGRKPLVLVRALILGLLMPASDDPQRDREVFLKLMTMDDEGMWRRCKGLSARDAAPLLTDDERFEAIVVRPNGQTAWAPGVGDERKKRFQKRAFLRMGYDDRLKFCVRPEEIDGPDELAWREINDHLSTSASNLKELVAELSQRKFGHLPKVGDAFAGGGSIPFEAARVGCEIYASDLNPTAGLMNYGALKLIGGTAETLQNVKEAQRAVYEAVQRQVRTWGLERNDIGWEADVFLYCNEVVDPITEWRVPLLPSLAIDPERWVIAELVPQPETRSFEIKVKLAANPAELSRAKSESTVDNGVVCPVDRNGNWLDPVERQRTSSKSLRGINGLRLWEKNEWKPRATDVYQERLYCVRWILPDLNLLLATEQLIRAGQVVEPWTPDSISRAIESVVELMDGDDSALVQAARREQWRECAQVLLQTSTGSVDHQLVEVSEATTAEIEAARRTAIRTAPKAVRAALEAAAKQPKRVYRSVGHDDLCRERACEKILCEVFDEWQAEGYLPERPMMPGKAIKDPIRNRGWSHWHHLYEPRQLLINGLFAREVAQFAGTQEQKIGLLLALMKLADWNGKLCRWDSSGAKCQQALYAVMRPSPYNNHACRGTLQLRNIFEVDAISSPIGQVPNPKLADAAKISENVDLWITDPGYGDMAPYAEYSEFYLAWIDRIAAGVIDGWYGDSKRALAVELADESFASLLHRCYANLTEHLNDDGYQIVMFTQQDAQVWADLTLLLWAAGLHVIQAWTIGTETQPGAKEGGSSTVQGTACLVVKKRTGGLRGDLGEIRPEVQMEVRSQLQTMLAVDDRESPNFSDSDYQLAAYVAALRVITSYEAVPEINVAREIARGGRPDPDGIVRSVIDHALREATDFLVPNGLDRAVWKSSTSEERLYLKGVEVEAHGERRAGVYQEFARGFGVREYRDLLQSDVANETRLRTPSELKGRNLDTGSMGGTLLRRLLYAIYQTVAEGNNPEPSVNWLQSRYPGTQFDDRKKSMLNLLDFLANTPGAGMQHWRQDVEAARILRVRLDNWGR